MIHKLRISVIVAVLGFVALFLAPTAAGAATTAQVAGSYVLHYEWYSAPGYWQTTPLTLRGDGTCDLTAQCTWTLSGSSGSQFTMSYPNPRRGGYIYRGTVTPSGLNSSSSYGHQYFGNPYYNNAAEGDWYATKG